VPPRTRKSITWLQLAVLNAGIRQGLRAMNWSFTWAVTREALGHDPSVEEVAEWWKESRRTAFREQVAFRAAFPKLDTPAPIYDRPELRRRLREFTKKTDDLDKILQSRRVQQEILDIGLLPATID